MHLTSLLLVICAAYNLATADPHHTEELRRSEEEPKLIKFIHKLLHTIQNDYQDPNWPSNIQPRMQSILSDDCSEEENQGIEQECDDVDDYSDEMKKLQRVDSHRRSYDNTDHVSGEVCFCDSYKLEPSKPKTKPKQAMIKSTHMNIACTESPDVVTSLKNNNPKLMTNLQNTHLKTRSEKRLALQDLIQKRLSNVHLLPRIQINQFGTNKIEQNLYNQLKGLKGYINKNQRAETQKNAEGYTEINCVPPRKVKSGKVSAYDDEDNQQRDYEIDHEKTDITLPNVNKKKTNSKFYSKQDSLEPNEYRRQEPNPIVTATHSNIEYSDVDIGHNKNNQELITDLPKKLDLPKKHILSKIPDQPKKSNPHIIPDISDQPKKSILPKASDQPKRVDLPQTAVSDQVKVFDLHKVSALSKVPDQPKIIIDDITEQTTDHTINSGLTTAEDLATETDMMNKETTVTVQTVTPVIDTLITTLPYPDFNREIDSSGKKSRRNQKADTVTPTIGTFHDQEAEATLYYPLTSNKAHRFQNFIHSEAPHGVPIAYELNPRGSSSHFQANYYNAGAQKPLQRIAKTPLFRASKDRFATIQHDHDYDDYGDYSYQMAHSTQFHLSAPAATVYWNSNHMPRHGKSVVNSHRFAKPPLFEEPQSTFEYDDFNDPELTAGWEDWEPSYNNDMLHDWSYLRSAPRELYSNHRYFI